MPEASFKLLSGQWQTFTCRDGQEHLIGFVRPDHVHCDSLCVQEAQAVQVGHGAEARLAADLFYLLPGLGQMDEKRQIMLPR